MTASLQFRRGTATQHSTFVGAVAEPTYSTDDKRLRIHDGATAGGISIAKTTELATQASTGNVGITRYASSTEAAALTSTATAVTPAGVALGIAASVASTGTAGITRYASSTEAVAAASTATAVTPKGIDLHSAPLAGNKNLTGGFTQTSFSISSSTSVTPSGLNGQLQYMTNNTAFLLNVPAADTALDILVTNSSNAGTVTFSTNYKIGTSGAGDALTTTNLSQAIISVRRINGVSTYTTTLLTTF